MNGIKVKSSIVLTTLLLGVVSLFFICWKKHGRETLPPWDYVKWVEDSKNGLKIVKKMKDFNFTIQYEPANFIVANLEKDPNLKTSVLNGKRNKYEDLQYFTIQILCPNTTQDILTMGINNRDIYLKRENYYSFDFERAIHLIENNGDTLSCALFNYAPNYGIAPHIDFLVAFTKSKEEIKSGQSQNDKTLIVEDEIFGNGTLQFSIKKEDINNIPEMLTY
jgi:hypothetical protein